MINEERIAELQAAFKRVEPKDHWKNPIDCVIDIASDRELHDIREAVIFFTGSVPMFTPRAGAKLPACRYRVQADGYFRTIGG